MMARLGDIFNLQMGKTPARANAEYWVDGENDWVSIADLSNYDKYVGDTKERITDLAVQESGIKLVPPDTVIMSFKLSLGKTAITKEPVYTNEAIMAFLPTGKYDVCADYFYHLFSGRDWSNGTNRAVMGATLNKATLSNLEINVPPLEEQHRIAALLDKVSDLIAKRRAQLDKLDLLVKSRFVEMFGDPVSNPMKWEKCALGTRCDIITGNTPSRAEAANYGTYIEWIKSDNINTPNIFLTTAQECLSETGFEKCRYVEAGCLLMTCIAGSLSCIGNVAITDRRVAFNQQINAIIPKRDEVLYLYWLMVLSKRVIHSTINMALKGILSKGQLTKLEFPFPPLDIQKKFAAFAKYTEKSKLMIQQSLNELEILKKTLIQQCFTKS